MTAVRAVRAALVLVLAAGATGLGAEPAQAPQGRRALVLYDGTTLKRPEGVLDAAHIANLLGHFDYAPVQQAIEDYVPGSMDPYDAVFVVGGAETSTWPAAVVRDARRRTKTIVWIGFGIDALLAEGEDVRLGVRVEQVLLESAFDRVRYRGVTVNKGDTSIAEMSILAPDRVTTEAVAVDPAGRERPYIVRAGPLWAVADVPFAYLSDRDRYFVFCDLLHDMLGVQHAATKRALIRLEDVTPLEDPDAVRRAVSVFVAEKVPFQIGLVPIYSDGGAHSDIYLSDRPDLVDAIHEAVAKGGTVVLHGSSHQYRGKSADDFEFWDAINNRARPDDSPELVRRKIAAALDECFRNDIYPIAWETPHYTASPQDYVEFGRVFSTLYERPLIGREQGTQQMFPYPTIDTRGLRIIPEDLGYLPGQNPQPDELIRNARALTVVRDGVASAYVHSFLDPRYLRDTVRGVKALGYTFVSLRDFPCRVSTGNRLITTGDAARSVTLQDEFLRQFVVTETGQKRDESWSSRAQSGAVDVALAPGRREILVALGMPEGPPGPPGTMERIGTAVSAAVGRLRQQSPLARPAPGVFRAAIVWLKSATGAAANDQASFAAVFRAYGVQPRLIMLEDVRTTALRRDEALVVPQGAAAALAPAQVDAVAAFALGGGSLVLDGRSALAERLGVRYVGNRITALMIRDTVEPNLTLRWQPPAVVDDYRLPPGAVTLALEAATGTITAAAFPRRAGKVLYLSAELDPFTSDGTSRYPFVFEHMLDAFGLVLPARRPVVELYFDPGLRPGMSIETLAAIWRRAGVRAIYAAAWEFRRNYTYDYERLIRVCHDNGILVYAWFEFPQVSPKFWQEHPEWREVPGRGTKLPSWREMMNLANPACRAAALALMSDVLGRWDWDGVNLAELNFDGEANGDVPEQFVPFNPDVRAAFKAARGFDPLDLLAPASPHFWTRDRAGWAAFLEYRRQLVVEWHRIFLQALRPFAAAGHEVIVTALDSLERPVVTANTGVDTPAIVALARQFPFTLQIEDPAASWADAPGRYERLAARYRPILPAGVPVMFDINVIPDRRTDGTHLPVGLAVGAELLGTVRSARTVSPRVAIYGDATIRPRDLEMIAYAAAGGATVTTHGFSWSVQTAVPIELAVPPELHDFYVGGADWPCWRPGFVLLPPGRHELAAYRAWFRLFDLSGLRPQLLQLSAPLQSCGVARGRAVFQYDDQSPAVARLGPRSVQVSVDGGAAVVPARLPDGGTTLRLPAGKHRVDVTDSGSAVMLLDLISIASSSLIVAFGTLASALLVALFLWIRVRRALRS